MKFLKFMFIALLAGIFCIGLNSCSKDDNDSTYYSISYDTNATGNITASIDGRLIIYDFDCAIKSVTLDKDILSTNKSVMDAEVIKACDAVYAKYKGKSSVTGTIKINKKLQKTSSDPNYHDEGTTSTIKEYTF